MDESWEDADDEDADESNKEEEEDAGADEDDDEDEEAEEEEEDDDDKGVCAFVGVRAVLSSGGGRCETRARRGETRDNAGG